MEGRVPILLGCLHASRTIVFLFFIQLRSPLRSFMEKQIHGKAKAYGTIAADTLQANLQNLPIVHKIQGVKMFFLLRFSLACHLQLAFSATSLGQFLRVCASLLAVAGDFS